ncbi:MAG: H-type lectin domain-containing protein [Beijerinckiaceae bacterium]
MIVMDSGTATARSDQDLSGLLNYVKFHGEFSAPPRNVFLALAGFRCSPGQAGQPSCFVKLDQVSTDGFTYLVQRGAAATDIYEVTISWLALDL